MFLCRSVAPSALNTSHVSAVMDDDLIYCSRTIAEWFTSSATRRTELICHNPNNTPFHDDNLTTERLNDHCASRNERCHQGTYDRPFSSGEYWKLSNLVRRKAFRKCCIPVAFEPKSMVWNLRGKKLSSNVWKTMRG